MLFDSIRKNRPLKLAVLFSFAATAPIASMPRESAQVSELRILTAEYTEHGPLMSRARFERFSDLMKQIGDQPEASRILGAAGFCGHASGGSGGGAPAGSGAAAVCPVHRRRVAKGDMSHLLAMDHWF